MSKRLRRGTDEWKTVKVRGVGLVAYHPSLEGYGWIRKLVKEKCLVRDGRLNLCWAVLPAAVAHGIITIEEAEAYIREAAKVDGKDPEKYLGKLRQECRRRMRTGSVKPPSWRSLLLLKRKIPGKEKWSWRPLGDVYAFLRPIIIQAFVEKGLVEIRGRGGTPIKRKFADLTRFIDFSSEEGTHSSA